MLLELQRQNQTFRGEFRGIKMLLERQRQN